MGRISGIERGAPAASRTSACRALRRAVDLQRVSGFVVPGMPNAHSHAFQRAMAGHTEYRQSAHDSFWTWRQAMYALANRITPEDLQVLATQLFVEMLKAGYTSVAEFHYLHRQPNGDLDAGPNSLWEAIGSGLGGCRHRPDAVADPVPDQRFRRPAAEAGTVAICSRFGPVPAGDRGSGDAERRTPSALRRTGPPFTACGPFP